MPRGRADIEAVRSPERLTWEAKGTTSSAGLDCDAAYGQLLWRMTDPAPGISYAVGVFPQVWKVILLGSK
ncbi:hypothetical protein E1289_37760 [Actinomadura sp. 6K520]|nr:hypothetical protein E1289_37760 [Actinomadura sp. 6K520]